MLIEGSVVFLSGDVLAFSWFYDALKILRSLPVKILLCKMTPACVSKIATINCFRILYFFYLLYLFSWPLLSFITHYALFTNYLSFYTKIFISQISDAIHFFLKTVIVFCIFVITFLLCISWLEVFIEYCCFVEINEKEIQARWCPFSSRCFAFTLIEFCNNPPRFIELSTFIWY